MNKHKKKNIIYILADDLGRGMLSCYGQEVIKTPNIDQLAEHGMKFTNFCATAFCAPSRASLICGIHDAHAGRWSYTPGGYYKKISNETLAFEDIQEILQHIGVEKTPGDNYIANIAKEAGYVTGEIGKLEWGFSVTANQMVEHGWDYHYGYYDHQRCHGFYPPFLFENGLKTMIAGNTDPHCGRPSYKDIYDSNYRPYEDMSQRQVYSQDLFDEKIADFIQKHRDEAFFLFHPSQLPHGPVFYPDIHEQVKDRDDLTFIEKEYASMVLRLDETVGKIVSQIEALGLTDQTYIMFSSDNGHTMEYNQPDRTTKEKDLQGNQLQNLNNPFRSQSCGDVFNGNDGMAGLKFSNWNGGCVVPLIVSCPSEITMGTTCDTLASNYDTLATVAHITGGPIPERTDGLSYLPLLRQEASPRVHEHVVYACFDGPAIVRNDGYKLRVHIEEENQKMVRNWDTTHSDRTHYQLFDLKTDFEEKNNLANQHPDIVRSLKRQLLKECDGNLLNGTPQAHLAIPELKPLTWEEVTDNQI